MPETSREQNFLKLDHIVKDFGSARVLHDIDIEVGAGEVVALLGPSGCGKSTLLKIIAGFFAQSAGHIRIGDRVVDKVPPHLRNLGMVFQDYSLFPHLTIYDNVAFGLSVRNVPVERIRKRVDEALSLVRLPDVGKRYPSQLSGGQKQRVAIARALVVDPSILLCDEPLSNLDVRLRKEIQVELKRIQRDTRVTTVYVTHDQEEAITLADRIALMHGGRIEQFADVKTIFEFPQSRFCAEFMGYQNFLQATVMQGHEERPVVRLATGETARSRTRTFFEAGAAVEACFRSDRVQIISDRQEDSDGDLVIEARLARIRYAGTHYILTLTTADGSAVDALLSASTFESNPLPEGMSCRLVVAADDIRLVAR
ncbi:MAG: ABC transporter ATP-binding protein [Mesorhizobium sp.]